MRITAPIVPLFPIGIKDPNHCEICWIDETKEEPHLWQVADTNPIADTNQHQQQQWSQRRQQQWLRGRAVAKQAVKRLLARCHGITVDPTAIQLHVDEWGRPMVVIENALDIHTTIAPPTISIAHSRSCNGYATIAIAVDSSEQLHVGIDLERMRPLETEETAKEAVEKTVLANIVFSPEEIRFLSNRNNESFDERFLRLWCTKEAVSKAIGVGLQGDPHHYLIREYNASTGTSVVICNTSRIRRSHCINHIRRFSDEPTSDTPISVITTRQNDWIIAIAAVPASVPMPAPSLSLLPLPQPLRD